MGSEQANDRDPIAPTPDPTPPSHDPSLATNLTLLVSVAMTSWYSPFKLARTAYDILVSQLFGGRSDYRVLEALGEVQNYFDYSVDNDGNPRESLWIDYVADVGDGFNPTFTVASLLTRKELTLGDQTTKRGQVLIMGGDQVYPSASRELYQQRMVRPYEYAFNRLNKKAPIADLFAIPGNHDWYDGLVSFMRLFGQHRTVAVWQTRQTRSYFALKLPHGFWILAVDIQLQADIDWFQIQYFKTIVKTEMKDGERIILCTAEPDWVHGKIYDPKLQDNLAFFEKMVVDTRPGIHIAARIAGDLHHYRRHESAEGEHNFIAGGGGAFLHPTHGSSVDKVRSGPRGKETTYTLKTSYPSIQTSKKLAWHNLAFPALNGDFCVVTAIAYMLLSLVMLRFGLSTIVLGVLYLMIVILFTDTSRLGYRVIGGLLHGATHASVALWVTLSLSNFLGVSDYPRAIASSCGTEQCLKVIEAPLWSDLMVMSGAGLAGAIIGPLVMGIYLLISLNGFSRHSNEAFSALRIQDYKNFLRLHITKDKLTIYPIGIDVVPKKWAANDNPSYGEPLLRPTDREIVPHLIENPIEIGMGNRE